MTSHYVELSIKRDPDFPSHFLMGILVGKLHRALVTLESSDIGVSFPGHRIGLRARTPGERLRIHSTAAALTGLMDQYWLRGMRDHVVVTDIEPIPAQVSHRNVRRRQFKTNAERLRRRRMRRHNEDEKTVRERIPDAIEPRITLPFVQIRSASSGERFSLFIEHGSKQDQPVLGRFNRYGLSPEATIPWF